MGLVMGGKSAVVGTIEVHVGDRIEPGQTLLNTETGKGNRPFKSMVVGIVARICVEEGSEVKAGDVLFEYREPEEGSIHLDGGIRKDGVGQELKKEYLETDIAIIGAGPGGYVTALYAAKQGLKTVLVEKGQLGGTCLNRGCIPTKALLQSAHLYEKLKQAGQFGIDVQSVSVDCARVFERKDRICEENRRGIQFLLDSSHVTLINGVAEMAGDGNVTVKCGITDYEIKAQHIILALGSRPSMPPWAKSPVCMDSDQALSDADIPESLIVIGAGVIGLEFAFMYAAYGCRVHVIEYMDHILGPTDPQAAQVVMKAAGQRGIRIDLSSKVIKVAETDTGESVVFYEKEGNEHVANARKVLVAVGRAPDFDGTSMDRAGIRFNKKGIETDGKLETSIKGIYAIGDVNGKVQLAHAASAQGIGVIDRILGKNAGGFGTLTVPSVIFTTPEIASVGKSESECREEGIPIKVSEFPFSANGKAKIQGETEGFVKLIMEEHSHKLLGSVIVGPDASALIGGITVAITNGLTDEGLAKSIFAHPTTSEAVWEAALGLSTGCIHYHE